MSHYLDYEWGIPFIVSYTTRDKREGETDGVDHHFINHRMYENADKNEMLAYTKFGDNHYFTMKWQTEVYPTYSYVVDEDGVRFFLERYADEYNIIPVYVHASEETRRARGIDQARIDRDSQRQHLPLNMYMSVINNDSSCDEFLHAIDEFLHKANEKYYFL